MSHSQAIKKGKKVRPNDPCPCFSGRKYKKCCSHIDWRSVSAAEQERLLSVRGRNLAFIGHIAGALQFDQIKPAQFMKDYKAAFTADAVKRIYEGVMRLWPPDTDIRELLSRNRSDVSGLYIGDYDLSYLTRGLVRHSIYANKLLVVDPFQHPHILADKFNPLLNPEQYRAQTLKNVNFYFSLMPWIQEGIVEIIRDPTDFDRKLNRDLMEAQRAKFDQNAELREAADKAVEDMGRRHKESFAYDMLLLQSPDDYLRRIFKERFADDGSITEDQFIAYVNKRRDENADFLGPLGPGLGSQLHMFTSGAHYGAAKLTAQFSGSYLVTDLRSKWKEIELDRKDASAENAAWAPFAKSLQEAKLKYLDNLKLDHALTLRKEGRLENLRAFLHKVWRTASSNEPFDPENSVSFASELTDEVRKAEAEWSKINVDLVKMLGAEITGGLGLAGTAGAVISQGSAMFLAAAGVAGVSATLVHNKMKKARFPREYPAAFFMDVQED